MLDIRSVTPTITSLMGARLPAFSTPTPIPEVLELATTKLKERLVEKCFIYAPDAIGEALHRDFYQEFRSVAEVAPQQVLLRSMLPPKTAVCFASMFSGATPETHGSTQELKQVVTIETIFDVIPEAGKKVAIVTVKGSSISLIFPNRPVDYFFEEYDQQVNRRFKELLKTRDYDLIVVYNQEYDDSTHSTGPRSEKSLQGMRNHLQSFAELASEFLNQSEKNTRVVAFTPDHGAHLDSETGRGTHGLDIPEDMIVRSFWGIFDADEVPSGHT